MLRTILRNLLVGYGLYQLSWWVAYPLAFAYGKLNGGIIYSGIAGAMLLPLVTTIPYALVAFGVGACVAWLVDSERPFRWSILPAALYVYFGIVGYHWAHEPTAIDRVAQVVSASFMGIACLGGALVFVRRQTASRNKS